MYKDYYNYGTYDDKHIQSYYPEYIQYQTGHPYEDLTKNDVESNKNKKDTQMTEKILNFCLIVIMLIGCLAWIAFITSYFVILHQEDTKDNHNNNPNFNSSTIYPDNDQKFY